MLHNSITVIIIHNKKYEIMGNFIPCTYLNIIWNIFRVKGAVIKEFSLTETSQFYFHLYCRTADTWLSKYHYYTTQHLVLNKNCISFNMLHANSMPTHLGLPELCSCWLSMHKQYARQRSKMVKMEIGIVYLEVV